MPYGFQPTPDDYVRQERFIAKLQALRKAKIVAAFLCGFLLAVLIEWAFL